MKRIFLAPKVLVGMIPPVLGLLLLHSAVSADSWQSRASMSEARAYFGAAAASDGTGERIYVIGGWNGSALIKTVEMYDPGGNSWTAKVPMSGSRSMLAACNPGNGKIYAVGGWGGSAPLDLNEEYNPVANTWSTVTPLPTRRWGCAGAAPGNGKMYVMGGVDGANVLAKNEEYDPSTNSWAQRAPIPTPRFLASTAVVGGKIYVSGGVTALFGASPVRLIYLDSVEIYDPGTNSWSYGGRLPYGRGLGAAAAMDNGMVYHAGGYGGIAALSSVERYNPILAQWWKRADVPAALAASAMVKSGAGLLYLMGGFSVTGVSISSSGVWASSGSTTNYCGTYTKDYATAGAVLGGMPDPAPVGTELAMVLSVTNSGDVSVTSFTPSIAAVSGGGLVSLLSGPSPAGPVVMTPGASGIFTWTFSVTGAGTVTFTGSGAGTDAETLSPVTATDNEDVLCAEKALLRSFLDVYPLPLAGSGLVTVSFTVSNDGGETATGVLPALTVDPGSSLLSYYAGPLPAGASDIPGGTSVNFTWDYLCVGTGFALLSASASGTDSLFGPVSTSAFKSTQPSAPAGLAATQGDGEITLRWNANPAYEAITGYTIYRATYPGFAAGPSFMAGSSAEPAFLDTGLVNGSPYFYRVSASNAEGEGAASAELSAVPTVMPSAAGDVRVTSTGPNPLYANPERGERVQILLNVPAGDGSLDVSIRSLLGEEIKTLFHGFVPSGPAIYEWDGRNARGNGVASGGYLAVVRFPDGRKAHRKVAILK